MAGGFVSAVPDKRMNGWNGAPSIGYSQAHTSATLAAQAVRSATASVRCTRSLEVSRVILMPKTSGDSSPGVSGILFSGIYQSLRTQAPAEPAKTHLLSPLPGP
jgi:hypothetical protein